MSHVALARKWRPQRFEDVIGQRGVVETLRNAIATGRLAQSFIFAGPRGVGKTTTARILARALNCVTGPTPDPCGVCDACREIAEGRDVDVLEIDGATYTGVDAVREVIVEPLGIAPMRDRFKVFIIDEVHRLSRSAFDALLKSIEEPPSWVKFMMATTELEKVPDTITSRSQVFELKALPVAAIRAQIKSVADQEGIEIDDAALSLVARSAEGSMRDALSALDQVLAFTAEKVTAADVGTVLGLIGRDLQFDIAEAIAREDLGAAFDLAGAVVEAGYDPRVVCRELARLMRDVMVVQIDASRLQDPEIASETERDRLQALARQFSREDLMRAFDLLAKAEGDIRGSSQPRHQFEMTLVKWIHLRRLTPLTDLIVTLERGAPAPKPAMPTRQPTPPPTPMASRAVAPPAAARAAASATTAPRPAAPPPAAPAPPAPDPPASNPGRGDDMKAAVLAAIREANKTFFNMVVVPALEIAVQGPNLVFTYLPIHYKTAKAQLERQKATLEQITQRIVGQKLTVVARERAPAAPAAAPPDATAERKAELQARAKAEPSVQAMLDVFGGEIEDVEEIK
jgi:DNA polymerase-3 subunit gamma/tau